MYIQRAYRCLIVADGIVYTLIPIAIRILFIGSNFGVQFIHIGINATPIIKVN